MVEEFLRLLIFRIESAPLLRTEEVEVIWYGCLCVNGKYEYISRAF